MTRVSLIGLIVFAWFGQEIQNETSPELPPPTELINRLRDQCESWTRAPGPQLRSLKYTYHLGNDERPVELVSGVSSSSDAMWQATTLTTGLEWVLAQPGRFDIEVRRVNGEDADADPHVQLVARVKNEGHVSIVAGNGISGSWRGYLSHAAEQVLIDLDPQSRLPVREASGSTRFEYHDWQEVQPGKWVPLLIEVESGLTHYRMHFAWQGESAWLLTRAESVQEGRTTELARVTDVVVDDQAVIDKLAAARQEQERARRIIGEMLKHNRRWLQPEPSFDTLQYTFHMPWPNVAETCVIRREGPIVFEVTRDGYGKMAERMGDRKIVLADGAYASADRDDRWAITTRPQRERSQPLSSEQLRRYALIGCQFDLPLFELPRVLGQTKVELRDGEWNGTRCHVATINVAGRSAFLGCGTMLGFSSWSYVHHLYPAYEVLYIDQRRNVPIHESFISARDNRRFEIDFSRWVEMEDGQSVPMRIDLRSENYFTCRYDFQLVEGQHWLLKKATSWFDPKDKSRGVVRNVQVNEPAPIADASLEQVRAYRDLFETEPVGGPTIDVDTARFELGKPQSLGPVNALFTLNPAGGLMLRCTAVEGRPVSVGQAVSLLLLDEQDRILSAAHAPFVEQDGRLVASADFGRSTALVKVARYTISGAGLDLTSPSSTVRKLRVCPAGADQETMKLAPVADESGKTRVIDVTLRPGEDDHMLAAVHFGSQDRMNGFGLDVSVGVFNEQGQLIAAGAKQGQLLVKSHIAEETWEIPLPHVPASEESLRVAMGVSRGQTYTSPVGSTWANWMTRYPIFSIERMLAAEDPGCWRVGLEELERHIRDEVLSRGLLDNLRDWKEQVAEQKTHGDVLRAHIERLLPIAERAEEPAILSAAIRVLGLSGDERGVEAIRPHLESADPGVRDVAAIALGMLGQSDALARIEAVLNRPVPSFKEDPDAYRQYRARGDDALIALVTLRTDESIPLVRKHVLESIDKIETIPHEGGGYSWRGQHTAEVLAKLMGCFTDARYVAVLTEAIGRVDSRQPAGGKYSPHEFITSVHEYGDAARGFLVGRVREGDLSALPSRDPSYVPAVREMLQGEDVDLWTIRSAIRYLWNAGTPEALDGLRDLYQRRLPDVEGRTSVRMSLLEALADRGDNRGLSEAFERLVELAQPGDPPEESEQRRKWQRQLDRDRDEALDVFKRAETAAIFNLLEQHADATEPTIRLAVLQVLEGQRQLPDALKAAIQQWAEESESDSVAINATKLLSRHR